MSLTGNTLGHYEILDLLGVGGMGEVYRGRDKTLDRFVAIKVLPAEWADDGERLARLQREAKVLAQLDHPNIAAIHGLEETTADTGTHHRLLIMQLAEGDTLHEWMTAGHMNTERAIEVGLQIASALESAHDRGVVHRDLKPANIKVAEDAGGHAHVKLLDFGLAKAYEPDGSASDISPDHSASPTVVAATRTGVILGTAAYMSPEQARGKVVDKRADIWAFGVVMFEMLSGRRLFAGETVSDTLAEVLKSEPDWSTLPAAVPPRVARLLQRCLEKDPTQRLRDIGEARLVLEKPHDAAEVSTAPPAVTAAPPVGGQSPAASGSVDAQASIAPDASVAPGASMAMPPAATVPAPSTGHMVRFAPWVIAAAAVGVAVWSWTARPTEAPLSYELAVGAPLDSEFMLGTNSGNAIISPDGTKIAFRATTDDSDQIWVRSLDRDDPLPLPGTDNPQYPFWSPDSTRLGFFAQQSLKTVDISGGLPETIAPALNGRGGSWGADGTILFTPNGGGSVHRVSENGGDVVEVTSLDAGRQENAHYWPQILPDGERFLYFIRSAASENNGIYLGRIDGSTPSVRLVGSMSSGIYAPPAGDGDGYLLWVRDADLLAQPLDLDAEELTGTAAVIASDVRVEQAQRGLIASVSNTGVLAWAVTQAEDFVVQWYSRQGYVTEGVEIESGFIQQLALSPDDSRLAFALPEGGTSDILMHDFATGTTRAVIAGPGFEEIPSWSAAGDRIIYTDTASRLMVADPDGVAEARVLVELQTNSGGLASPDDDFLVFVREHPDGGRAPAAIPMGGPGDPVFLTDPASPNNGVLGFSPDGNWTLLVSFQSGRAELYATRWIVDDGVPRLGDTWTQVSDGFGFGSVRWTTQGEIIYVATDNQVVAVPVTQTGDGISLGRSQRLFAVANSEFGGGFIDISSDGQRFVMRTAPYAEGQTLRVLTNWHSRLPGGR